MAMQCLLDQPRAWSFWIEYLGATESWLHFLPVSGIPRTDHWKKGYVREICKLTIQQPQVLSFIEKVEIRTSTMCKHLALVHQSRYIRPGPAESCVTVNNQCPVRGQNDEPNSGYMDYFYLRGNFKQKWFRGRSWKCSGKFGECRWWFLAS